MLLGVSFPRTPFRHHRRSFHYYFSRHVDLACIERSKLPRLRLRSRHLRGVSPLGRKNTMSTFTLPDSNPAVLVNLPSNLSREQLLNFPAFKTWISTLQHSLQLQQRKSHVFHASPYVLRKVDVQVADWFGKARLGFVKLKAEVTNKDGEGLPAIAFLRGGSVAILVRHSAQMTHAANETQIIVQPDDLPSGSDAEQSAILTIQPRIPAGSLAFAEIPAGMLDNNGSFSGAAAKEIEEETGLQIEASELVDMTELTLGPPLDGNERLQNAIYPSPGGSDEFIPILLSRKRIPRRDLEEMSGKLTGLREHGEKITLKLVSLDQLWKIGARDGKTLAAWALYEGLRCVGRI